MTPKKDTTFPKYYEFFNSVKIISGFKALDNMAFELSLLEASRPIIVTDKGITKAGLIDHVVNSLGGTNVTIGAIYDDTPVDSSNVAVNEIARIYRESNCDSIIAVGGGSVIDTCKGVNIVISEETDDLLKFMGNHRLTQPMKPFIVIPTTGSGSEVTMAAVIFNVEKKIKMQFTSALMLPKLAILDPEMTLTMPPHFTAATAMDAMTHAVEAYIGPQKNPISDNYATAAISVILGNIHEAVKNGKNKEIRLAMANATLMAGLAFSNSMVGIVHATAHASGAVCHIPHGIANSILLPHCLEYYIKHSPVTKNYIADLLLTLAGPEDYVKTPAKERANRAVAAIRELTSALNKSCNLPLTLKEAGVPEEKLKQIAETTLNDGAIAFSPVEVSLDDALAILNAAY